MSSLPDITATKDWQSVNALTGISVGVGMNLQHKGTQDETIFLCEGAQPLALSRDGRILTESSRDATYSAGSQELWIRSSDNSCKVHVESL